MKVRSLLLAAGAAVGPASFAAAADVPLKAPEAPPPPFFFVNDTTFGVHYDPNATDPGVGKTAKTVLEITHFDAWQYGTNFVNFDWLYSDRRDPAQCDGFAFPTQPSCQGTQGTMEFYGLYRGTFGGNQLTHSTAFTFGPIKNIDLSFGGDWNTQNNAFAPEKKDIVAGVKFEFNVPQGFFNVAVHAYKEWNHNGLPGTIASNVDFKAVPEFEFTYMQPLTFTGLPLRIAGFTNVVTPKGADGFGVQTKTELLTDNRLVLDIGQVFANKPNWWDAYVGYRYWRNKFGNDDNVLPFAKEETYYVGVAWHALTDSPPPKPANMPLKAPAPAWTPFFLVSDTSVGVHYDPNATDPGVNKTAKTVFEITHFDVWALGTNFINLDWLYSDRRDPAECDAFFAQPSCQGTQGTMEFYGLYRGTWGLNQLSGTKAFTFGPFKNIDFSFGGDWNTQNNAFAPEKKDIVAGVKFEFNVPQGFFNVAVHAYKEWNHNALPGTIVSNVEFNVVPEFEFTYMAPLAFTGLPLKFVGFTNVVTPKGRDGFGNQTVTELLTDNRLVLDVGKTVGYKANLWDAYVGYRYWRNKFGNDDAILPFAKEETYYVGVAWHAL